MLYFLLFLDSWQQLMHSLDNQQWYDAKMLIMHVYYDEPVHWALIAEDEIDPIKHAYTVPSNCFQMSILLIFHLWIFIEIFM